MKHVSILVPEGTASGAVTASMDVLNEAGRFKMEMDDSVTEPFFKVELISLDQEFVECLGGYALKCHKSYKEISSTDLILVSNLTSDFEKKIRDNMGFIDFMKKQYAQGADIGAFCTGTLLLAATGLLDNNKATTHWMAVDIFKKLFPKVNLLPDKIITDEGRLFCAGGSTSFLNLVIYLVEKYCGHEIAVLLSKSMLIDMDKAPQSAYAIFSIQKEHGHLDILNAQNYIENYVNKEIKVDDLVDITALSKRSFNRKFKEVTGNTPNDYIQRVKMEWARNKLEFEDIDIQQLSYQLAYNDPGTFRRIFKKHIGITPKSYRDKFKRMAPKQ